MLGLCVCLGFVSCSRAISVIGVHDVCYLVYFISDTIYVKLQYVYVVSSGVCSFIGKGRSLVSPC